MKIFQKIAVSCLTMGLFVSVSSCYVLLEEKKHDNGKHKGQHKNWPKHHGKSKKTVIVIKDDNSHDNHENHGKKGKKSGHGKGHGKKR